MNGNGAGAGDRRTIPFGRLPEEIKLQHQSLPQFPPDLEAALRVARERCGDRYCVAVFTADEAFDTINLFLGRGAAWRDDPAFLKAYQLFVGEFLKLTPERLNDIRRGPEVDSQAIGPQTTSGPASPPQLPL